MMDVYRELAQISRLLLAEEDSQATVEAVLLRLLERVEADRGFIVLRSEGSYRRAFDVGWRDEELSSEQRRFSRSLVREAIDTRRLIHSSNLVEDERFASLESVRDLPPCSVLAAPLVHDDDVHGCIYLERLDLGGFSEDGRRLAEELGEIAGLLVLRAMEREDLRRRNRSLEQDLSARYDFAGIVAQDPAMLRLLETVARVADSDAPILILGETGTGKELVAKALHLNSPRRRGPFVTVHCAALPGELLESELFGHSAGAFTGARKARAGRIAAADGGTLFLDEVGEISPETQAKLLRFLQFGEIQRLGEDRVDRVDVRVVSATHRRLPEMVENGEFREDLFYRLRVLDLEIPPLRERRGDLPVLLDHMMRLHWRGTEPARWTSRARAAVLAHDYPGNVRELEHLVRRVCLLAQGERLDVDLLPEELLRAAENPMNVPARDETDLFDSFSDFSELTNESLKEAKAEAQARVEAAFLERLMQEHDGNVSRAARAAGFHRTFLQKMLARHRLVGKGRSR